MEALSDRLVSDGLLQVRAEGEFGVVTDVRSQICLIDLAIDCGINEVFGATWELVAHLGLEPGVPLPIHLLLFTDLGLNILSKLLRLGVAYTLSLCLAHQHLCIGLFRLGEHRLTRRIEEALSIACVHHLSGTIPAGVICVPCVSTSINTLLRDTLNFLIFKAFFDLE